MTEGKRWVLYSGVPLECSPKFHEGHPPDIAPTMARPKWLSATQRGPGGPGGPGTPSPGNVTIVTSATTARPLNGRQDISDGTTSAMAVACRDCIGSPSGRIRIPVRFHCEPIWSIFVRGEQMSQQIIFQQGKVSHVWTAHTWLCTEIVVHRLKQDKQHYCISHASCSLTIFCFKIP